MRTVTGTIAAPVSFCLISPSLLVDLLHHVARSDGIPRVQYIQECGSAEETKSSISEYFLQCFGDSHSIGWLSALVLSVIHKILSPIQLSCIHENSFGHLCLERKNVTQVILFKRSKKLLTEGVQQGNVCYRFRRADRVRRLIGIKTGTAHGKRRVAGYTIKTHSVDEGQVWLPVAEGKVHIVGCIVETTLDGFVGWSPDFDIQSVVDDNVDSCMVLGYRVICRALGRS